MNSESLSQSYPALTDPDWYFGTAKGASDLNHMLLRIRHWRGDCGGIDLRGDCPIGCFLIAEPFFLTEEQLVDPADNWAP